MTYRPSIAERIAWTNTLRPVHQKVLQALATYANFETGRGAYMSMDKLVARAGLPQRTVERALHQLEAAGWITATRHHRHATVYDLRLDWLATNYVGAKVVTSDYRSVRQIGGQEAENLSATFADLSAKSCTVVRQIGGPIPSTDPLVDPSAPPLRAGEADEDRNDDQRRAESGGESAIESATAVPDVCADGRAHPDDAAGRARGRGSDQAATPGAGVPLRQQSDSPGAELARPARPPVEPQQQTFGPLDVSDRPRPQWKEIAETFRAALERKSG